MKAKFCFFFKVGLLLWLPILLFKQAGQAGDVVLLRDIREIPELQLAEIACRFYGLDLQTIIVDPDSLEQQADFLAALDSDCLILSAPALPLLSQEPFFSAIHATGAARPKILIFGVTPDLDLRWLKKWSADLLDSCQSRELGQNTWYQVADSRDVARELAGQNFATKIKSSTWQNGFLPAPNELISPLITIVDKTNNFKLVQCLRIQKAESDLFVSIGQKHQPKQAFKGNWRYRRDSFFTIAPILMFLRSSVGEKCWHSAGDYANLTIDDPWLIEPYGFLRFSQLLQQMNKVRFHTTIAFIPWNYDRNRPDVVALLRQHPEQFSICVHGNNHDHREFWKYQGQSIIPGQAKSLAAQEQNIRQALDRMQVFHRLTGLAFDPVMVFPHAIAPERTLGMLKKYQFLATFNSGNVPLGAHAPVDPAARLRSVAIDYEDLPSFHRFEASPQRRAENEYKIAVDLFLDNPVLLFSHHNLFQNGIDAFNRTATFINRTQPEIRWLSLADIARKSYLQRQLRRNSYEVLAFAREFILTNPGDSTRSFLIRKNENFHPPIQALTVNGAPQAFDSLASKIVFSLVLNPGETKKVVLESDPAPRPDSVLVSKNTRYQHLLRQISDFRDLTLTTSGLGRGIDLFYNKSGLVRIGPVGTIIIIFMVNLFLLGTAVQLRIRKNMKSVRKNSEKWMMSST